MEELNGGNLFRNYNLLFKKLTYNESDRINELDHWPIKVEAFLEAIFSVKHPSHAQQLALTVGQLFLALDRSIAQSPGTEFPSKKFKYSFI